MAKTLKPVAAADVRAWLLVTHSIKTGSRGRLSQEHQNLFNEDKDNKRKGFVYTVGHKDEAPVEVKVDTTDRNGRKRVKTVKVTVPAARTWAEANGQPVGKRGRVSQETLVAYAASTLTVTA